VVVCGVVLVVSCVLWCCSCCVFVCVTCFSSYVFLWHSHTDTNHVFRLFNLVYDMNPYICKISVFTDGLYITSRPYMLNARNAVKNTVFYSYLAWFVNTFTLNMCVSMSYIGLTRRNTVFKFLWLRHRNT